MTADETPREVAERYLDEMIAAEEAEDHAAFVKRFEERDVDEFGESRFRKERFAILEELGTYRSREYLGELNAYVDADEPDRHPNGTRHVWRGIFEKNETLVVVGIHERDGVVHVNEILYCN